ncbi:hypothetical protein HDU67_002656 [Dinochytrium kinnereticum]|nr:hypothetical protein HDU67_002656 [Dinochytrium kinnereticum]
MEAFQLIAEKRYPEKTSQQSMHCTLYDVCIRSPAGPSKAGTTGTHKARFDENGVGKGLAGRDAPSRTDRLDKIVGRGVGGEGGYIPPISAGGKRVSVLTASEERLELVATQPKKSNSVIVPRSLHGSNTSLANIASKTSSTGSLATLREGKGLKDNNGGSKTAVFDRLTNSNGYTGTHKHRFNAAGTGRGLAGRDSIPKNGVGVYRGGDVKELSQILRPGF